MKQLLGDQTPDNTQPFLKDQAMCGWYLPLPQPHPSLTLQELAIMADKIIEVSVPPPSTPIINKVSSTDLASELAQLRHKVVQLKLTLQTSARSLSRTHSPSPQRTQRSPDRQSSNCWYHPLLGLHALSSPHHYNALFPQLFTHSLILVWELLNASLYPVLYGQTSMLTSVDGHANASSANDPKYNITQWHHFPPLLHLNVVFKISIWI